LCRATVADHRRTQSRTRAPCRTTSSGAAACCTSKTDAARPRSPRAATRLARLRRRSRSPDTDRKASAARGRASREPLRSTHGWFANGAGTDGQKPNRSWRSVASIPQLADTHARDADLAFAEQAAIFADRLLVAALGLLHERPAQIAVRKRFEIVAVG